MKKQILALTFTVAGLFSLAQAEFGLKQKAYEIVKPTGMGLAQDDLPFTPDTETATKINQSGNDLNQDQNASFALEESLYALCQDGTCKLKESDSGNFFREDIVAGQKSTTPLGEQKTYVGTSEPDKIGMDRMIYINR